MTYGKIIEAKACKRCGLVKAVAEFYERSYLPGAYTSECKACMKERGKSQTPISPLTPRSLSEAVVIEYLQSRGVFAVPGKAVSYAHVDVVAWGCVGIEVKYSAERKGGRFVFSMTPAQQRGGFRAEVVCLVFDYAAFNAPQFHFFSANDDLFASSQEGRRIKSSLEYVMGREEQTLNQARLDESRDRIDLIEACRKRVADGLKVGSFAFPNYVKVTAPLWTEEEAAEFMRNNDLIDEARAGLRVMTHGELSVLIAAQRKLLDALKQRMGGE